MSGLSVSFRVTLDEEEEEKEASEAEELALGAEEEGTAEDGEDTAEEEEVMEEEVVTVVNGEGSIGGQVTEFLRATTATPMAAPWAVATMMGVGT